MGDVMFTAIGSQLRITNPSDELIRWCKGNLELMNPDYQKKQRMGFWTGKTPVKLYLYEIDGNTIVIPFGCLRSVMPYLSNDAVKTFAPIRKVDFGGQVPLYDYQLEAVVKMHDNHYGILQSPAGSGKTQMGIALAQLFSEKTLWLTHTKDLLNQSKKRAEMYIDPTKLGVISEGKVEIGETMTFATIQTMARLDLSLYKDTWDVIIVDECHRVAGTPTAMTMFSHVLNNLRARHKYGLSATVHRADGLIKATYALLGSVVHVVSDSVVKDRIMDAVVKPVALFTERSTSYLNSDGTINYAAMINYLTENNWRTGTILNTLVKEEKHYNLILSERVSHLKSIYDQLPYGYQKVSAVIDGKTKKDVREKAIEDMRNGKLRYLFATYALAKEGLDIPRLDRLHLVTPQKDYAVIVQAVGRIRRKFAGKETPIVYDYVDYGLKNLFKAYKTRCTHYRKCGCTIED